MTNIRDNSLLKYTFDGNHDFSILACKAKLFLGITIQKPVIRESRALKGTKGSKGSKVPKGIKAPKKTKKCPKKTRARN